ncbi:MAG TPA: class I SAM-dependent methyltransferase [Acidimicrobiales bacterium]|nr:class I SAM-dependent methyltransferase [Acidimicrobiales bacterium]
MTPLGGRPVVVVPTGADSQTVEVGFYEDQVLPRFINWALANRELARIRERVTAGLSGEVLEVGFGSGLNVPYYPGAVRRVKAVDPATVGRELARGRVAASPVRVDYVALDGQELPIESASVDHALITWTLCTIPDPVRALGEIRRVLRPGAEVHFVEHGRSPDAAVARWQDRLTPLQRRLFGGCHLNRQIDALLAGTGFEITRMDRYYIKGPRALGYMFEGVATRP